MYSSGGRRPPLLARLDLADGLLSDGEFGALVDQAMLQL
jgi:hypothetical protein